MPDIATRLLPGFRIREPEDVNTLLNAMEKQKLYTIPIHGKCVKARLYLELYKDGDGVAYMGEHGTEQDNCYTLGNERLPERIYEARKAINRYLRKSGI